MSGVMGLDLSLAATGLACGSTLTTIATDPKAGDRRYCRIRDSLVQYVSGHRPRLAMIEAVPPYDHASSGLERVHGVAREVLARYEVRFAYVNVTALKSFAVADGRADKAAMIQTVWLATGRHPADDNQADAWWLMRMGAAMLAGSFYDVPHRVKALASIEWPWDPNTLEWPRQYGPIPARKPIIRQCRHRIFCLKNGDQWLHPFHLDVCDKPPKPRPRRAATTDTVTATEA